MNHNVVDYLRGHAPRTLDNMVIMDDHEDFTDEGFEACHDLIQWMFPTMTPSAHQPDSPVLSWDEVLEVRGCPEAQAGLEAHLNFYKEFLANTRGVWLRQYDHNHLRITRVIQSLVLLMPSNVPASRFKAYVAKMNADAGWPVNVTSVGFWNQAMFYADDMKVKHG